MSRKTASAETEPEPVGITLEELPVKVRLRVIHAGRWVAWAEDDQSVLAAADTFEEVHEAVERAGRPKALYEWVPPVPVRPIGR